ncbi:squalene/phytoene synthase family protein [Streptomyces sp. ISL-100]|uniref:squalene/phytoene synthase family protein n=1 Tax=Streptomyces sp. ISL-100 TaxID=2819173 RepID=UPI001BE54DFB|nr:squalene/phytoene synthase family protein [Streptomyces sp. ISL-100]MBT2401674.1 squalene/phytoene synthase family protein [Streptomyces sp. ISL-100]
MHARELTAAGLHDRRLADAYTCCGQYLSRRNSAAYPMARLLLPPGKRPYWDAVLAFSTYVDDLIDDQAKPTAERLAQYDAYVQKFLGLLAGERDWPRQPGTARDRTGLQLALAFRHFTRTWNIPTRSVHRFLTTIRTDLWVTEYPRYADLAEYIDGVCGQGTIWGNALLEPQNEEADSRAVAASFGLQLTDYLRDLREDLADGRLYLPVEDLREFGLSRAEVEQAARDRRMTPPLRELVEFQTRRARRCFAEAADWWRLVHPSAQELPRQYVRLGRISLEQIQRSGHDIFHPRPRARLSCATASCAGFTLGYVRATAGRRTGRRTAGPRPAPRPQPPRTPVSQRPDRP